MTSEPEKEPEKKPAEESAEPGFISGKSKKNDKSGSTDSGGKATPDSTTETPAKKRGIFQKLVSTFVEENLLTMDPEEIREPEKTPKPRGLFQALFGSREVDPELKGFTPGKIAARYQLYREVQEKDQVQRSVYEEISAGARPTPDYWILVLFSAVIASLGLLQSSSATVIGAMIIAPLMGPIMGLSLGTVWGDLELTFQSLKVTVFSILLSIFLAGFLSLFGPVEGMTPEVVSRTAPNLLDLGVAFACGFVGAYALTSKRIGSALPGVAISVALMPPLCAVGISMGAFEWARAGGAFILFFTNFLGISVAGCLVFWFRKVHPAGEQTENVRERIKRQLWVSGILLALTIIPLAYFSLLARNSTLEKRHSREIIENSIAPTYLDSYQIRTVEKDGRRLKLVRLRVYHGLKKKPEDWKALRNRLARTWEQPVKLEIREIRSDLKFF